MMDIFKNRNSANNQQATRRQEKIDVQQAIENLKGKIKAWSRLKSTIRYLVGRIVTDVLVCGFSIWPCQKIIESEFILKFRFKSQVNPVKLLNGFVFILAVNTAKRYSEHFRSSMGEIFLIKREDFFKIVHYANRSFNVKLKLPYMMFLPYKNEVTSMLVAR